MRTLLLLLIITVKCVANPLIVTLPEEPENSLEMLRENVEMFVGPEGTTISGVYTFTTRKKEELNAGDAWHIQLPVYVSQQTLKPDLSRIISVYAPKLKIGGVAYEASSVDIGGKAWDSFWRGAKFFHATFVFKVPTRTIESEFTIEVEYRQPHMIARGISYACYTPFLPEPLNGALRGVGYDQFKLRATAMEGVELKRISKNKYVKFDQPATLEVYCRDQEAIIIKISPKSSSAEKPSSAK